MIFYFTATGNSLYVAKQLDKNIVSIPQIIHNSDLVFKDESIGLVCPVYGHEVPAMVREFLQKATFLTDYFYVVLTYGNRHGGAAELANELMKSLGIHAVYINTILMVDNFLPVFDMDEQKSIDKNIDEQIAQIKTDIQSRRNAVQAVSDVDRQTHQDFLSLRAQMSADVWSKLYHYTEACTVCGVCTKVCPASCYRVENARLERSTENCQACMACIHHCPQKAIQLNMPEKNPQARYRNEHISLAEIIASNEQVR